MSKYNYHIDSGHGWLEVLRCELRRLNILNKISEDSYQKGNVVYLEHDFDSELFMREKARLDEYVSIEMLPMEEVSEIRGYEGFRA